MSLQSQFTSLVGLAGHLTSVSSSIEEFRKRRETNKLSEKNTNQAQSGEIPENRATLRAQQRIANLGADVAQRRFEEKPSEKTYQNLIKHEEDIEDLRKTGQEIALKEEQEMEGQREKWRRLAAEKREKEEAEAAKKAESEKIREEILSVAPASYGGARTEEQSQAMAAAASSPLDQARANADTNREAAERAEAERQARNAANEQAYQAAVEAASTPATPITETPTEEDKNE